MLLFRTSTRFRLTIFEMRRAFSSLTAGQRSQLARPHRLGPPCIGQGSASSSSSHLTSQLGVARGGRSYATQTDESKPGKKRKEADAGEETDVNASSSEKREGKKPSTTSDSPFPGLEGFFGNALKRGSSSLQNKGSDGPQKQLGRNGFPFGFGGESSTSSNSGKFASTDKSSNSSGGSGNSNTPQPNALGTFLVPLVGLLVWNVITSGDSSSREITWQEFRTAFLDKGLVDKLTVVNRSKVRVHLHSNATGVVYPQSPASDGRSSYYFSIGSVEAFEKKLDEAQKELGIPSTERVPVAYKDETSLSTTLISFAPTLMIVGLLYYLSRRAGGAAGGGMGGGPGGIFGVGKSKARMFNVRRTCGRHMHTLTYVYSMKPTSKSSSRMWQVWMKPKRRSWNSSSSCKNRRSISD